MAVEITPLGFQKPDGNEAIRNGDNVISANADKADELHAAGRARLAQLENAAGFGGAPLDYADDVVAGLVTSSTGTRTALDARFAPKSLETTKLDASEAATLYAAKSVETTKLDKSEAASTYTTPVMVSTQLDAEVPPLVAAAIAADPTPANAAAAAVSTAMANSNQSFTLPWIPTTTNGNLATARGTPTYTAGKFGNALTTGILNCDNLLPEPVGYTQTIECWVKSATAPTIKEALIWGTQSSMWLSAVEGTGYARFTLAFTTGSRATSTVNICDGNWHHVVVSVTRESGTTILKGFWVDGIPTGATAPTNARAWPIDLIVGGHWSDASFDWPGQIDDLRVSVGQIYSGIFTPPAAANTVNGRTLILAPLDSAAAVAGNEGYAVRPVGALDGTVTYVGPVVPTTWRTDDKWEKLV